MLTKNSVVEIKNLTVNHESPPFKLKTVAAYYSMILKLSVSSKSLKW